MIEWAELEAGAPASADRARERAAAVRPDQVSDIMFTSGTTGRSKGAMSAHRQALAVARAWAAVDAGQAAPPGTSLTRPADPGQGAPRGDLV